MAQAGITSLGSIPDSPSDQKLRHFALMSTSYRTHFNGEASLPEPQKIQFDLRNASSEDIRIIAKTILSLQKLVPLRIALRKPARLPEKILAKK